MKKTILTLLALVFLSSALIGTAATSPVDNADAHSCKSWLENRHDESSVQRNYNEHWVLGFMSGVSTEPKKYFIKDTDHRIVYVLVDVYCQSNPHTSLGVAGQDVAAALIKQRRP